MSKYQRVETVNDWGAVGYFLGKIVRSEWGTVSLGSQDPQARLLCGDQLEVRWPDGSETQHKIVGVQRYNSVSDHGNSYDVGYTELFVEDELRGEKVQIPLVDLMVRRVKQ